MDQNHKQQAVEQLRNAATILITTSKNPSIDQIAASLGLSKMLEKLEKNVTTVITSPLPGSLGFLNADKDLDDNLDSLRDFIISLDKEKADKLRYKVEGDEVRIFITPYHTQIKKDDIRFSQGDFNVDAVVVVGTVNRTEIDQAVMEQSRVLNETPTISISAGPTQSNVGGINWHDPSASSVSEMIVSVSEALQPGLLDNISSNVLLTGIIAATDHFSNPDTSPKVMTMAAQLMAAGADQQTIMRELKSTFTKPVDKDEKSIAKQNESDSAIDLKANEETKSTDKDKEESSDSDIKINHSEDTPEQPVKSEVDSKVAPIAPTEPVTAQQAPVEVPKLTEQPIDFVDTFPIPAPAPEPAAEAGSDSSPLDEARAAVDAAVSSQPVGTPMNPVASLGTQDLPGGVNIPNEKPLVAPQLDVPADTQTSNAVTGSVNPAQLYPDAKSPYDQQS